MTAREFLAFAQWLKANKGIELPQGDDASWFKEHNLPMIASCICCGMTMPVWVAYVDEDDHVYCADCAGEEVDVVEDGFECPKCGENRVDCLVNEDGYVTCESCGHEYDLNPIIVMNPWSGEMVEVMETEITQDKLDFMATLMDDEIRERIHTFDDCDTPGAFFRRYVEIVGAEEAGRIWFA